VTATHVNGLAVIAVEPARSTWRNRKTGELLEYRQMLRLLLEDGSEVFGCLHCDYTHQNLNSVRPHLNKHRTDLGNGHGSVDIPGLIKRLNEVERLEQERDRWKARAYEAERELRKIRQVFGGLR
jgi:hypothetical protein